MKIPYKKIAIIILLISTSVSYSQKQNNMWYFGPNGAGLNFNNCTPTVLTNGIITDALEGESTISDETTGSLLFYTDGLNIYDSTHNIMQNGNSVGLTTSQTQNIIIKKTR